TKAVWSRDNRTAGFRLCGEGTKAIRIECRIGGADLNPYLAIAALIASGLAGIDQKLELAAPFEGDAYSGGQLPEVPRTRSDEIARQYGPAMLKEALGQGVGAQYLHSARDEKME